MIAITTVAGATIGTATIVMGKIRYASFSQPARSPGSLTAIHRTAAQINQRRRNGTPSSRRAWWKIPSASRRLTSRARTLVRRR